MSGKSRWRTLAAATAAVGALIAAASPALAQSIGVGSTVSGQLTESDGQMNENYYYDSYTLSLAAGQGVTVRLSSPDFDSYVYIGQGTGDDWVELMADDDGGSTEETPLASRLRFLAPEAGTYIIRASSFGEGSTGNYDLSISETRIVPPPTPRPLAIGGPQSGAFTADSPTVEETGQPYDLFTYQGQTGEILIFRMNAAADGGLDPYLEVGRNQEWGYEPWASDDDGGASETGPLDSRVVFRIPEDGEYQVRAMGLTEGSVGGFSVSVEPYPQPAAPRPTRIRVGDTVEGAFDEGEIINDNLQIYDVYSLRVTAGRETTINLRANDVDGDGYADFDAFLELGEQTPAGWAVALVDDDSGADETGLHSRLTFTPAASGTMVLRVMALGQLQTGTYTLSVE